MTATYDTSRAGSSARAEPLTHPGWGVRLLGWICVLFGLVIAIGGVWLIALGEAGTTGWPGSG